MANVIVQETKSTKVPHSVNKLNFLTKLSYGFGEFSGAVVWSLASSYLLFFYTDVFGLAGGVAAIILLVARVWDCFVDPILGLIMERTKSKHGRFRPYILYGAFALCALNILTFYTPDFSMTGKIIYAGITYLLLGTVHSMVSVPYGALATVMTRDTEERTSLNAYRGVFGQVAGILTGAAVMPLIMFLGNGNQQNGFFYAAIVLSLVSAPLLFMTFKNCKEVIAPEAMEKPSIKESLKAVSSNIPLLLILANLFIVLMGLFGRLGTLTYYAIYVLNRPELIAVLFTLLSVCGAIGALFLPFVAKFMEKKTLMIFGTIISGVAFIAIYFTSSTNISMIIIWTIIACIPIGLASPLCFSMVADCIDEHQVKTGKRADGSIYSVFSLSTKIANAIVGATAASILGLIGYVANTQQTPEVVNGINMLVNLGPGILFILSTIPLFFYKITKARASENTQELLRRKSELTE
ncbi:MFS transporter [Bacillus sp. J37]|uniref:MFS transporter n=1 Tax=Bacillus sp. J37 TaxID=935837 RepID=UPI00047A280D|nr:MFS transporter [Bacillus sp. J37]